MFRHSQRLLNVWTSKLREKAQSNSKGTLNDLNMAVKDVFWTKELPTTAASKMLRNFHPEEDAECVQLARAAGASFIGKTNCDEFGMGCVYLHIVIYKLIIGIVQVIDTRILAQYYTHSLLKDWLVVLLVVLLLLLHYKNAICELNQ